MGDNLSVLLTTEGTYPFSQGGVSTWCDILVKRLKNVDYTVFGILMDPFVTQKFDLGGTKLVRVPLWGTEEPSEHLETLFSATYLAKQRTTDTIIEERFLPLFRALIEELITVEKNDFQFADVVVRLYDFFAEFDYKVCFKSELTWNAYKELIHEACERSNGKLDNPDVYCLIQSLGWVYRFFNIINTPVPRTTVAHASAAAFCGLPCIVAKLKYGTPFLLTEHGVYLREQYLSLSKRGYPSFLNTFLIRMIHSVTGACYTFADQISPVCEYNTRWERQVTGRHERIQVIYNGVDNTVFSRTREVEHDHPTVVMMARIDPIKDIFTLLRAAARVRERIPDVRFLLYGSVSVPEYHEECLELRRQLQLEETVEFCGHITNVVQGYESADIIVQSSISEAFPYSVVEAMFAGKAVVSTNVGGIAEALGDHGILTRPGDPEELADGITRLLENPALRSEMAADARERALSMFTIERSLEQYLKTYIKLALQSAEAMAPAEQQVEAQAEPLTELSVVAEKPRSAPASPHPESDSQRVLAERGFALMDNVQAAAAIAMFWQAIDEAPSSGATAVLWVELAYLYDICGRDVDAQFALEQAERTRVKVSVHEQRVFAERGYALRDAGEFEAAIGMFERAIMACPNAPAVSILLLDLAACYGYLGRPNQALELVVKSDLIASLKSA